MCNSRRRSHTKLDRRCRRSRCPVWHRLRHTLGCRGRRGPIVTPGCQGRLFLRLCGLFLRLLQLSLLFLSFKRYSKNGCVLVRGRKEQPHSSIILHDVADELSIGRKQHHDSRREAFLPLQLALSTGDPHLLALLSGGSLGSRGLGRPFRLFSRLRGVVRYSAVKRGELFLRREQLSLQRTSRETGGMSGAFRV